MTANTLTAYLDALTNAQTVEDFWRLHSAKMASFGFDRLIYGFTRYRSASSLGDPQDWVVLTNQPPEYMTPFVDEGLYFHAPMVKWALENDGACSWRWMEDMARADGFTASERRVVEFNRKMGVLAGYTISFRSISARSKGAIALTARAGMTQDAVEQVWAQHGDEILVITPTEPVPPLTREAVRDLLDELRR